MCRGSLITVFGEQAVEDEQIDNIDDFVGKLVLCLLCVRNSVEENGLEAWRRLHGEYDPTSSMRHVAILQQVQEPPRCQRVEGIGICSGRLALEETSVRDVHGQERTALFRLMPKSLEQTVAFTNEDEGFQELFD